MLRYMGIKDRSTITQILKVLKKFRKHGISKSFLSEITIWKFYDDFSTFTGVRYSYMRIKDNFTITQILNILKKLGA